jgi:plastocyanin
LKKLALVALVGVLCSILLAACGGSSNSGNTSNGGSSCDATHVTMTSNTFCETSITISKGGTITFIDDKTSGTEHILVIGQNGSAATEQGAADLGGSNGHTFQAGDSWTTPAWNTAGTFHVTCTIHPTTMNLTITVQ